MFVFKYLFVCSSNNWHLEWAHTVRRGRLHPLAYYNMWVAWPGWPEEDGDRLCPRFSLPGAVTHTRQPRTPPTPSHSPKRTCPCASAHTCTHSSRSHHRHHLVSIGRAGEYEVTTQRVLSAHTRTHTHILPGAESDGGSGGRGSGW